MGIFDKLFNSSDNSIKDKDTHDIFHIDEDLMSFLEEADELYIRAFETRSIGILKNHFTRECCLNISRWIVNEASSRFFGDKKFRNTTWKMVENENNKYVIIKTCVYKDIRLTLSRTMKVSEDYKERWTVQVTPEEYFIQSVCLEE